MSDGIAIYNKSDIDAIVLPNTIPTTYQLEVGTQYVSMMVSNYSPYYFTFAGLDNKVFATVKPWTITPVFLSVVGRVLVNVNASLGSVITNNNNLLDNETLKVTLSTKPNYNSVVELNPQTGINYNFQNFDLGTFSFAKQTLSAGQQTTSQWSDWIDIQGAKVIMLYEEYLNLSGVGNNCNAMIWFHVTSNELYPQDFNQDGGDNDYWGVNGNSYNAYGATAAGQPGWISGWDKFRCEFLIRNSDGVSHTISGEIHAILKVAF